MNRVRSLRLLCCHVAFGAHVCGLLQQQLCSSHAATLLDSQLLCCPAHRWTPSWWAQPSLPSGFTIVSTWCVVCGIRVGQFAPLGHTRQEMQMGPKGFAYRPLCPLGSARRDAGSAAPGVCKACCVLPSGHNMAGAALPCPAFSWPPRRFFMVPELCLSQCAKLSSPFLPCVSSSPATLFHLHLQMCVFFTSRSCPTRTVPQPAPHQAIQHLLPCVSLSALADPVLPELGRRVGHLREQAVLRSSGGAAHCSGSECRVLCDSFGCVCPDLLSPP